MTQNGELQETAPSEPNTGGNWLSGNKLVVTVAVIGAAALSAFVFGRSSEASSNTIPGLHISDRYWVTTPGEDGKNPLDQPQLDIVERDKDEGLDDLSLKQEDDNKDMRLVVTHWETDDGREGASIISTSRGNQDETVRAMSRYLTER